MGLEVQEHVRRVEVNFSAEEIQAYERVFKKFDLDGKGRISFYNLRRLLKDVGEDLSDEQLHDLIAEVDINKNTTIELDEFLQVRNKTACSLAPFLPSFLPCLLASLLPCFLD